MRKRLHRWCRLCNFAAEMVAEWFRTVSANCFYSPFKTERKMERQDLTRCAARAVREMADAATLKAVAEAECFRTKERFCRRMTEIYRRAVEDRDVEVGTEVMRCSHVCVYLETQHSLHPCEEDLLMTVQLRLSCAESRHAVVVECKVPVCWLPRRGVPVEFRFGEVPWGSPAVVDRSLNRVMDYDPRCHAFVPSPRRERETYAERYAQLMKQ